MDSSKQCGAVTLIKHVANPIILARQASDQCKRGLNVLNVIAHL